MQRFFDLLEESVIVQSMITLIVVSGITYLATTNQPIPEILAQIGFLVVGYWFGTKQNVAIRKFSRGDQT